MNPSIIKDSVYPLRDSYGRFFSLKKEFCGYRVPNLMAWDGYTPLIPFGTPNNSVKASLIETKSPWNDKKNFNWSRGVMDSIGVFETSGQGSNPCETATYFNDKII